MLKRIFLAAALLSFSTPALAQGFYAGGNVGLSIFHDSDASNAQGSATISYKMGFAIGGALGYRYNHNLRFEAEVGYKGASMDKVSAGGQSAPLTDSSLSTYGFLANAYYDITQAKLPVTPFVGAGLGIIYGKSKSGGTSDSDTEFGYQGMAGVSYAVSREFSLSAQYRYQGSSNFSKNGNSVSYGSSNILAGALYSF